MTDAPEARTEAEPQPQPEPELLHGCPVTSSRGQQVVHCMPADYERLITALKDEGYEMCVDVTAADYLGHPGRPLPDGVDGERFEVVVNLLSMSNRSRVRVRVQVPEEAPEVASLFPLYVGTEAMEREVFDMFGIRFEGHPDLTRILMPDDWEGHPLRKDYAQSRIPVQFKAPRAARSGSSESRT